jgi:ribosomal protein S18 acetylase RimI-like enzyme
MRDYVEQVWGWDEDEQIAFFDDRFEPEKWQVIQADGEDVGVLIVEDDDGETYVAEIQVHPSRQGRGLGSSVLRSLMESGPVTLRVLHVNERARALYERLGFKPYEEIETHTYLRWAP